MVRRELIPSGRDSLELMLTLPVTLTLALP